MLLSRLCIALSIVLGVFATASVRAQQDDGILYLADQARIKAQEVKRSRDLEKFKEPYSFYHTFISYRGFQFLSDRLLGSPAFLAKAIEVRELPERRQWWPFPIDEINRVIIASKAAQLRMKRNQKRAKTDPETFPEKLLKETHARLSEEGKERRKQAALTAQSFSLLNDLRRLSLKQFYETLVRDRGYQWLRQDLFESQVFLDRIREIKTKADWPEADWDAIDEVHDAAEVAYDSECNIIMK